MSRFAPITSAFLIGCIALIACPHRALAVGGVGACCLPDTSCLDFTTQFECEVNLGGIWQGPFTDCFANPCGPGGGLGACCLPDTQCLNDVTSNECEFSAGGVYQGDNTACVSVNCAGGPPPVNDDCQNAIPVGEGFIGYDNINAQTDGPDEPGVCDFFSDSQVASDVWFCYLPSCTGDATIALCGSNYDTKLAVYADCACPVGPSAIACNDDDCGGTLQSQLTIPVVQGQPILIRIGGYLGDQGTGTLDITCVPSGPPPVNDDCQNANPVGEGLIGFDNFNAQTDGPDEPGVCDFFGDSQVASDVWFCYTPSCTGDAAIALCGSNFDTKLAVYDGCACPVGPSAIACNDDDCGGTTQSQLNIQVVQGQSILIRIGGYLGAQGIGNLEISCGPGAPTGACCLPGGQCLDNQTVSNCTSISGGSYNGDGSFCSSSFCPGPVGACCFDDGICIDGIGSGVCLNSNGIYQGDETDCSSAICPVTPGACCLPDGTCIDGEDMLSCESQDGLFQGQSSLCNSVSCPSVEGACCLSPTNDCTQTTESDCASQGGTYQGDLTSCEFNACDLGACCLADGTCVVADSDLCMTYSGNFQGVLTECDTANCAVPIGACCDGVGGCSEISAVDCDVSGGSFLGNGSSCSPDPCAIGACCQIDGECVEISEAACLDSDGAFSGAGSTCGGTSCPVGACCFPDGICIDTTQTGCLLDDGEYLGDGTLCDTAPCVVGACCQAGGCFESTESDCLGSGGVYTGNFSDCLSVDCTVGACCESDGTCSDVDPIECSGEYLGDGTTCQSDACDEPIGACCLPNDDCQDDLTESVCVNLDGEYQGDGSLCSGSTCLSPCSTVFGDLDTSCFKDGSDIQVFVDCFVEGATSLGSCECGDYDESGLVDIADLQFFVDDLLVGGGTAPIKNPEGVISVTEIPSPELCSVENPKDHKINASWSSPECGIEQIRIVNLTTGVVLAEQTYPFCPTVMSLEVTAALGLDDVIQTTVLTCGGDENHPCCPGPATDEVKSCPIKGADYLGISDEQRTNRETRTLTCAGAPANSVWTRIMNGEGDVTPAMNTGATYPMTATHDSKPVDDVDISRKHVDGDGDRSFSDSKLTVIGIDMKIHKPKVMDSAESAISDADELTKGAVTFVNLDNDDQDTRWENGGAMPDNDVPGEDEMCKVRLRIKPKGLPAMCGNLKLSAFEGAGSIKVWKKKNKKDEYTLGTDIPVPGDLIERDGWLEKDLWIEGILPHTTQRQSKLRLTFDRKPEQVDEVAVTLIGIEKIEWVGRMNSETDTNVLDADPNYPAGLSPGSLRVFPDARIAGAPPMLEANPRDQVDVKVTLSVAPLAGQPVKIFFRSFDVDDPTANMMPVDNEATEEDNRGTAPARRGQFIKADGTSDEDAAGIKEQEFDAKDETFRFRVTMQPGDNFRVVGNGDKDALKDLENKESTLGAANADKQRIVNPKVGGNAAAKEVREADKYASNVLTVWRRLHVERDRMGAFPAAPNIQANTLIRQIVSITGNAATAQRINVTANIPIMMDTNGNGAGDTMDNTSLLGAGGSGRFQGGTVQVGTNMVATANLDGNGMASVRRNAGISIPATVSKVPLVNATGNVIALAGRVFTINVGGGALLAGHNGGNINVAGVNMTIAAVNLANSTVTVTADPVIMINLADDDAAGPPAANRFTLMQDSDMAAQNLYSAAYIRPKFNGGGAAANETSTVAAILNTEFSAVFSWNSRANNTNRFWVVYTLSSWQDSFRNLQRDMDDNTEGATGGSLGVGGGFGTHVYMEAIRERGPTAGGGRNALEDRIVVHEVGHQMRLNHGAMPGMNNYASNGIMNGSAQANPGANQLFIPAHLNQLRGLNQPR